MGWGDDDGPFQTVGRADVRAQGQEVTAAGANEASGGRRRAVRVGVQPLRDDGSLNWKLQRTVEKEDSRCFGGRIDLLLG